MLILLIISGFIFVVLNIEYRQAMSIKEFQSLAEAKQSQEQKLLGQVSHISFDYFTIIDIEFPENTVTYYFEPDNISLEDFALGDVAFVTVEKDQTLSINKIPKPDALQYLAKRKPFLKFSITQYPKTVLNACEEFKLKVKIKNWGDIPIKYDDIFDANYGYAIIYQVNGSNHISYSLENFDVLNPGEEKELVFETNQNTNSNLQKGENTIQFSWGQKSLYDLNPEPLTASEKITIFVEQESCDGK